MTIEDQTLVIIKRQAKKELQYKVLLTLALITFPLWVIPTALVFAVMKFIIPFSSELPEAFKSLFESDFPNGAISAYRNPEEALLPKSRFKSPLSVKDKEHD